MADSLYVHTFGASDAPDLVAVHGVTGHGARFARLAETRLSTWRVTAPDLRGHGRSERVPPWTLEQHAADLLAVMDARGIDSAPVVGHSFGGLVATHLARLAPQRVRRLVLLDPAVHLRPADALAYAEATTVVVPDRAAAVARQSADWPSADAATVEAEIEANWVPEAGRWRPRYTPAALSTAWSEMCRAPQLPPPGVPTLLVRALGADFVDDEYIAACRYLLGDDFRHIDMTAGHMLYLDDPDRVAELIEEFLA